VRADGQGLPPGHGSVAEGRGVFAERCAACHGDQGQGGLADPLAGGFGTLTQPNPVRTVGSYWSYATTLFDFIRRAMPFNAPESLDDDQVYAVSAYVLSLNGIISDDTVLNASNLAKIVMPNRNDFISPDPRPDIPVAADQARSR
jgi:cytochrome c